MYSGEENLKLRPIFIMFHLILLCMVDSSWAPTHSWRKHEWSCRQGGTEVFVAASGGHMSKGSVWINGFSRGWWAETDRCKGSALPTMPLCFPLTRMNCLIDFGKQHQSGIYQTCFCALVSLRGVIWDGGKISPYVKISCDYCHRNINDVIITKVQEQDHSSLPLIQPPVPL